MRLDRNPSISSRAARWFVFLSAFAFVTYGQSPFQSPPGKSSSGYAAETVIVKPRRGSNAAAVAALHASAGARVRRAFPAIGDLQVVDLPPGLSVEGAFDHYRQSGLVEVERARGWRESGRVGHGQSEYRGVDRQQQSKLVDGIARKRYGKWQRNSRGYREHDEKTSQWSDHYWW